MYLDSNAVPAGAFEMKGRALSCEPYGKGHINETYLVKTDAGRDYILQKINSRIFRDVPALMKNIQAVTAHLRKRESDPRRVLTIVPARGGGSFVEQDGQYFRVYDFVTGSLSLDAPETAEDFAQSAAAFGRFQKQLSDFPAANLSETIPHFHDTPRRYLAMREAIRQDVMGRAAGVRDEINFALAREQDAALLMDKLRAGLLPLRVTHNDTKLNNVLFDSATRKGLCVIDLDTVMPGLCANDFGDSIRFGASTAAEDERDLSRVSMSLEMYRAYKDAFLAACGDSLRDEEIAALPVGAKLMTLECGVRFLTDYLSGDTYFRVHREGHNLDRCRTQLKLVEDMEDKWSEMRIKP